MSIADLLQTSTGFILTAICWGFTNPFIKRGAKGLESIKRDTWVKQTLAEFGYLLTNWQYLLPLILNLCGSMVYYYTLSGAELTMAVPITNSLTLLFTSLAGYLIGEEDGVPTTRDLIGMGLILCGVALCVTS